MARPLRLDPDDGWHHVMNRGVSRIPIFADDNDRTSFGQQLAELHERFAIVVHAYCLMDNHFHLLVHCPHAGLSEAMQRLSSMYTRHTNDRHGRDGSLFRGRFHSRLVTDDRYLLSAVRYIHRNALDLPGVADVAGYRWSSHRTYLGLRQRPHWLDTEFVLDQFAGQPDAFDRFVRDPNTDGPMEGGAREIELLRDAAGLVLRELTSTTDSELASTVRAATLIAVDRLGGFDAQTVASVLGIPSAGAHRTALSRARVAASHHAEVSAVASRAILLAGRPVVTSGV